MPYGTVNLRNGVPNGETPVTSTAGVGTVVIEFGALSRLTGKVLIHILQNLRFDFQLFKTHVISGVRHRGLKTV